MMFFEWQRADFDVSHPASQPVDETAAAFVAQVLDTTGDELLALLRSKGIVLATPAAPLDLDALTQHLVAYDVAVLGGRARDIPGDELCDILCACRRFLLRGGICQHYILASAIHVPNVRTKTRNLVEVQPASSHEPL